MPTVPLIIRAHVAKERLGTANGVCDAFIAFGRVTAPLVAARLYDAGWAWLDGGVLLVIALPFVFSWLFIRPRGGGWRGVRGRETGRTSEGSFSAVSTPIIWSKYSLE